MVRFPCPYMDLSIGNVTKEPLKISSIENRNRWLGPYRDDIIGRKYGVY